MPKTKTVRCINKRSKNSRCLSYTDGRHTVGIKTLFILPVLISGHCTVSLMGGPSTEVLSGRKHNKWVNDSVGQCDTESSIKR